MKKEQTSKLHKLTTDELKDYRVPLEVFIDFNEYIFRAKGPFKKLMLESLGVNVLTDKDPKVDWEAFLKLDQIMKHRCKENSDYSNFIARIFDPSESGFVKAEDFEKLIYAMFESEQNEQEGENTNAKKVESFADNMLAVCRQIGIYEKNGCFSSKRMKEAFNEGQLEIDTFMQALK